MGEEIGWIVADASGGFSYVDRHGRSSPCELPDGMPLQGQAGVAIDVCGKRLSVKAVAAPPGSVAVAVLESDDEGRAAALETLVNQIAHDIRNFAFTIGLQAEMGLRGAPPPESRRHLNAVLRQVDSLKRYIDQLLLFGRPVRLDTQTFDLGSFLREEIQRFQFSREPSPDSPPSITLSPVAPSTVRWDRRAVGTVLAALLDNAARAASPPPPITVSATVVAGRVVLQVRDQGAGMSPETVAALATPMKVRRAGAAGLGLAIARKLARAHGGTLDLESGPGGTLVTVTLPREVPAA